MREIKFNNCKEHVTKHFVDAGKRERDLWTEKFPDDFNTPPNELVEMIDVYQKTPENDKKGTPLYAIYYELARGIINNLCDLEQDKKVDFYLYSDKTHNTYSVNSWFTDTSLLIGANYFPEKINIRTCFICENNESKVVCYLLVSDNVLSSLKDKNSCTMKNGKLCIENIDTNDESVIKAVDSVLEEIRKRNLETDADTAKRETIKNLLGNFVEHIAQNKNMHNCDIIEKIDNGDDNAVKEFVRGFNGPDRLAVCSYLAGIDNKYRVYFQEYYGNVEDYIGKEITDSDEKFELEKGTVNKFIRELVYGIVN